MRWSEKRLIMCGILVIGTLFSSISCAEDSPKEMLSNISGEVTDKTLSEIGEILGTDFSEPPSMLFYYSSNVDEFGGYEAYVKAVITEETFEKLIKKLKLLPREQWPSDSSLQFADRWIVSNDLSLPWWDINEPDDDKDIFGSFLGEVGFCFAKYENNAFYYHAFVLKQED